MCRGSQPSSTRSNAPRKQQISSRHKNTYKAEALLPDLTARDCRRSSESQPVGSQTWLHPQGIQHHTVVTGMNSQQNELKKGNKKINNKKKRISVDLNISLVLRENEKHGAGNEREAAVLATQRCVGSQPCSPHQRNLQHLLKCILRS